MKQLTDTLWRADSGMTFQQISTQKVVGTGIDLGKDDNILNYQEIPLTEENKIPKKKVKLLEKRTK